MTVPFEMRRTVGLGPQLLEMAALGLDTRGWAELPLAFLCAGPGWIYSSFYLTSFALSFVCP